MCAEAFEPDTPADPMAVIADLQGKLEQSERAQAGLYADLRAERGRRHDAEKRAERAEQSLARQQVNTPGVLRRERDEAIRLAQEAFAQLDRLVPLAESAPQPDFHASRINAAAHALKQDPVRPEPAQPANGDYLTERANELSEEIA